jgi:threonine synthase
MEYRFNTNYLMSVRFKGDMNFWRYKPVMPPVKKVVTLGEGGTPYWHAIRLGDQIGLDNLILKDETRNPTSSFKDRSASLIISDASSKGFSTVVSATSGNHGASLAAYSAKEEIRCQLVVSNELDLGKLAQMIAYNAEITEHGKTPEEALEQAVTMENEKGWYQATTELNPLSVEALKTVAYELVEQGGVPDWVVVAMGSGVTIHSVWKGFNEMEQIGLIEEKPRLIGVQAEGCAPITQAYLSGEKKPIQFRSSTTVATAIRNPEPRYGALALKALKESDGITVLVSDNNMLNYGREIARTEGIFAEPASAATVACLQYLVEQGTISTGDHVVSLITSSGLKTNDIIKSLKSRKKTAGIGSRLATKESLLTFISQGKTYGYALWKKLDRRMTLGAVYQHLGELEDRGLIQSESVGKRRYLTLTSKGSKVLSAMDELRDLL